MAKLEDALEKTGNFKLLICNDGSSDRTSEILNSIQKIGYWGHKS